MRLFCLHLHFKHFVLIQRSTKKKVDDSGKQLCSKGFCLQKDYSKLDKPDQKPIDVEIKLDSLEVSCYSIVDVVVHKNN